MHVQGYFQIFWAFQAPKYLWGWITVLVSNVLQVVLKIHFIMPKHQFVLFLITWQTRHDSTWQYVTVNDKHQPTNTNQTWARKLILKLFFSSRFFRVRLNESRTKGCVKFLNYITFLYTVCQIKYVDCDKHKRIWYGSIITAFLKASWRAH